MTLTLPQRVVAVHDALDTARLPHAFGGALALAWCTGSPRGTVDIDVNVFVGTERATDVLAALPDGADWDADDAARAQREGQVRVVWDRTPIDVFLNTDQFHLDVATRIVRRPFGGRDLPFLSCDDLAVFKAFYDRTQDWADLEAMSSAGTLDTDRVGGALAAHLGADDPRIVRLRALDMPG